MTTALENTDMMLDHDERTWVRINEGATEIYSLSNSNQAEDVTFLLSYEA
jgi:hypothetical protein